MGNVLFEQKQDNVGRWENQIYIKKHVMPLQLNCLTKYNIIYRLLKYLGNIFKCPHVTIGIKPVITWLIVKRKYCDYRS